MDSSTYDVANLPTTKLSHDHVECRSAESCNKPNSAFKVPVPQVVSSRQHSHLNGFAYFLKKN